MMATFVMQISSYEIVEALHGKPGLYLARHLDVEPERTLLIKTFGPRTGEGSSRRRFLAECSLLSSLEIPSFAVLDAGYDKRLDLDYYAALVPGRFTPMSFDSCPEDEQVRLLLGVASAIRELNEAGFAYRNFAPASFGRLNDGILLYDFARATRFGTGRLHSLTAGFESFDPPEARRGEYDALKGEAYGLGHLMREAGVIGSPSRGLADRLMSSNPDSRPTIEEVIQEFHLLRF